MVKSLPRICRACKKRLKGDFNRHAIKHCAMKDSFEGWIFLNHDGTEVSEQDLPIRHNRITDKSRGKQIGKKEDSPISRDANCWRKVRRMPFGYRCSTDTVKRAFFFFSTMTLYSHRGEITGDDLKKLLDADV